MPVHDVAAAGFGNQADVYERSRPSYPPEMVAWLRDTLGIAPGRRVVDLAAGTGKLTRLLEPLGAELVAVEPVTGMLDQLHTRSPGLPALAATAEQLPFRDGTVDAITVAQAFHWFDALAALEEMARVVHPGGRVALVWNARDRSIAWVDQAWSVMDRVEKRAPWRQHDEWRESAFVEQPWFTPLTEATFRQAQVMAPEGVVDRFRSVSHVAVLPEEEREQVLDDVRTILATHPDTRGRDEVAIPYRVDAYWCERLP
jgi:SAM-dependent methyltransferase